MILEISALAKTDLYKLNPFLPSADFLKDPKIPSKALTAD
jgi:hypothetical protein